MQKILGLILVVVVGITYFFFLQTTVGEQNVRKEIRGAYQEIQNIADELAKTDEPGKIKAVVQNFANDLVSGFKAGFEGGDNGANKIIQFNETKNKIILSNVDRGISGWSSKEKFIGLIENKSSNSIGNIKLNLACYSADKKLMDVSNEWLSAINILSPNEKIAFSIERSIGKHNAPKEDLEKGKCVSFDLKVISFKIKDLPVTE